MINKGGNKVPSQVFCSIFHWAFHWPPWQPLPFHAVINVLDVCAPQPLIDGLSPLQVRVLSRCSYVHVNISYQWYRIISIICVCMASNMAASVLSIGTFVHSCPLLTAFHSRHQCHVLYVCSSLAKGCFIVPVNHVYAMLAFLHHLLVRVVKIHVYVQHVYGLSQYFGVTACRQLIYCCCVKC